MTTYIDSPAVSATSHASLPGEDFLPGVLALWSLPLNMVRIWIQGWSTLVTAYEPEEDRHSPEAQLPVPNPIQQSKDRELFA